MTLLIGTVKSHTCETQLPICIYQPVQGVVDLMDARQCSQVGIQLKIWCKKNKDKMKRSHESKKKPHQLVSMRLSLAQVRSFQKR